MREQKQTGRSFGGKGYYIALILCAVAIGITGYLYYQNAGDADPQLMQPTQDAVATLPGGDLQVIATTPTTPGGTTAAPTTPATACKLKTGMPVTGQTVMGYAMDCLSYNPTTRDWRVHDGLDIAAEAGTPVYALDKINSSLTAAGGDALSGVYWTSTFKQYYSWNGAQGSLDATAGYNMSNGSWTTYNTGAYKQTNPVRVVFAF